jgi:rod shape-determining protein MreC
VEAYPTASLVLLATDPSFAAGVVSQRNHVFGTLKGQGHGTCIVDYVQNEQRVDAGERFYTSGYDRVFPSGFPAGQVTAAHNGRFNKEIFVNPSGLQGGLDEVLVVLSGVHQAIPENELPSPGIHMMSAPTELAHGPKAQQPVLGNTTADRLRTAYQQVGEAQGHRFGEGLPGSTPPNFNLKVTPGLKANPAATRPSEKPAPDASDTEDSVPVDITPPEQPPAQVPAAPAGNGNGAPPSGPKPKQGRSSR